MPSAIAPLDTSTVIKQCIWFDGLPSSHLDKLAQSAKLRDFDRDEHVYRSGSVPLGVYGVLHGSLKIVVGGADEQDSVITVLSSGAWFGEIFLFARQRYFADCIALQKTQLIFIDHADMLNVCEHWPPLYRNLLADVSRKALHMSWMSAQYKRAPPELRLAHRLNLACQMTPDNNRDEWVELRERLSHELLAQMLGLSRPRLTLAMQTLSNAGLLLSTRGRIQVQRRKLEAYCSPDRKTH